MNTNALKKEITGDNEMGDWTEVVALDEIPQLGSRVIKTDTMKIAVFRTASDEVFAMKDECPHKKGPLSQGIVHGTSVTCPLHNWRISLESGKAQGPDEGCTGTYDVKLEGDKIFLDIK